MKTILAIALPLVALSFVAGCSSPMDLGGDRLDASVDARGRRATDECGNGRDDDGNGRIDDGCPCAPGETQACFAGAVGVSPVGACRRGTQRCEAAAGSEWGDWGAGECAGQVLPAATDACDGVDDDCDGAIDEGCPCDDGATRACGEEFVIAPCSAGIQTCRGGTWGACDGAVRPVAEVCDDGIDNDCDGAVDDIAFCDCVPEPEICRDGIDNDCDGEADEMECTPDWLRDGGMPDGGTVDEGCPTLRIPDFRDRIVWETVLPNAGSFLANTGGHPAARLAGNAVAIGLHTLVSGAYTFGSESLTEDRLGYLAFADGAPLSHHAWPGPSRIFDTSGGRLGVAGLFRGTIDVGLGAWTSDPTEYTTGGTPPNAPAPDFFVVAASTPSGVVEGGQHFAVGGIAAHPMPGSFFPTLNVFAASVDPAGNVYLAGRFEGRLEMGGRRLDSSAPIARGRWGGFVASFTPTGTLRWLESTGAGTAAEMAIDASGRYVTVIQHALEIGPPADHRKALELRDSATGAIVFRHLSSTGAGGSEVSAVAVDALGNVTIIGQSPVSAAFTLGPLTVPPGRVHVSSFDRTGSLRWSHDLMTPSWPNDQVVRYAVATDGTEVAIALGFHILGAMPVSVQIGTCAREVPRRVWVRGSTTGRPVESTEWGNPEVEEAVVAVLEGATGAHRWSRLLDGDTSSLSLGMHSGGDLVVALHGSLAPISVNYGAGLSSYSSHVFRLRNR